MAPKTNASTSSSNASDPPLPLPQFLKLLTSSKSLTMSQAMQAAGKLLPKGFNTLTKLKTLNQVEMAGMGIADEEIRKGVMMLIGKGGKPQKRKRGSDMDQPLPTKEVKEVVKVNLEFDEILYEPTLAIKSVIINRAPVMTAWATIVAERLGFRRQEALSIASVYTEMNASSKGVSLGIFDPSANKPHGGPSQPFVELMGRKVPVLSMQSGEWRAVTKGAVTEPSVAFGYLQRSFKQTLGAVMGSLRLLAESFPPQELNQKGYGLYCEFRPESEGWGKKAEMLCSTILGLRRHLTHDIDDQPAAEEEEEEALGGDLVVKPEPGDGELDESGVKEEEEGEDDERSGKRRKADKDGLFLVDESVKKEDQPVDPFDAALDDDLNLSDWDESEFL